MYRRHEFWILFANSVYGNSDCLLLEQKEIHKKTVMKCPVT
jgi:hypothetical protein